MARSFAHISTISLLLIMAGLIGSPLQLRAADAPAVLNNSAPAAAQQLERLYRQIHPAFWQNANLIPSTPEGTGGAYELTASVEGRVGCGGPDMLLLKMHGESIDALVPRSFQPTWLGGGGLLRIILRDNDKPKDSNAPGYIVLAVAPEVEVAELEKASTRGGAHKTVSNMHLASATQRLPTNLPHGHPIAALSAAALAVYPYYRASVQRYNRRLDSLTVDKITTSVLAYSDYYHLDPRLVMAMIIAESGFDPNSVSSAGAIGVSQLMPSTAAGLGVNPYDPVQNVGAAVKILSSHVSQYGGEDVHGLVPLNTLALTMAAYNAGVGAVQRYHGIPPYAETQNYVRKVAALYRAMCGG